MGTRRNISATVAVALVAAVFLFSHGPATSGTFKEADKPIAAQLFASPEKYAGRTVTIYGLVIGVEPDGSNFLLQDVSQAPLKVVRSDGRFTMPGDQLIVVGKFVPDKGNTRLEAETVTVTKVTGGGGCC